jgi:hypothetical protein
MNDVHSPVETAMAYRDDVVLLLVALGANVNLGIKEGLATAYSRNYLSLLDWAHGTRLESERQIQTVEQRALQSDLTPTMNTDWKGSYMTFLRDLKRRQGKNSQEADVKAIFAINEIKDYVTDVEKLLVAHNAQTWNEIYPDKKSNLGGAPRLLPTRQPFNVVSLSRYIYHTTGYGQSWVPKHLIAAYDELYEACFTGDNSKIQQLCFPPDGSTTLALQISVQSVRPQDRWATNGMVLWFM